MPSMQEVVLQRESVQDNTELNTHKRTGAAVMEHIFGGVNYTRQLDIFNPITHGMVPVTVLGAGSIGGAVVLNLAKVGFRDITVYDGDDIDDHNLPNQFFPMGTVGMKKVEVLQKLTKMMTGTEIKAVPTMYEDDQLMPLVITCVDNMRVRQLVFEKFKDPETVGARLGMIDPRTGGLTYRIFTVKPDTLDKYHWYPDEEASMDACTARSIIFTVFGVTSIVVALATRVVKGLDVPHEVAGEFNYFTQLVSREKEKKEEGVDLVAAEHTGA